jgi:hypothetical protein
MAVDRNSASSQGQWHNFMTYSHFELSEAQKLVPWLTERFEEISIAHTASTELSTEIHHSTNQIRSNGHSHSNQAASKLHRISELMDKLLVNQIRSIEKIGVHVKGIEPFLVDFPFLRNGHEVYLCWKQGETEITHWHETGDGFAGRQPL